MNNISYSLFIGLLLSTVALSAQNSFITPEQEVLLAKEAVLAPADTVKYLGRWKSDCYTTYTFSARGRCEGLYELMLSTPHQRYLNSET